MTDANRKRQNKITAAVCKSAEKTVLALLLVLSAGVIAAAALIDLAAPYVAASFLTIMVVLLFSLLLYFFCMLEDSVDHRKKQLFEAMTVSMFFVGLLYILLGIFEGKREHRTVTFA